MIAERNDKSLCEKSMKMVVNIIKLSSFSIAKMSLGVTGHPTATKNLTPATDSHMVTDHQLQHPQLLQSSSKPYSFVMQPGEGTESLMVHEEKRDDDSVFAAYITKVQEKNRNNLQEASKLSTYIPPPPPPPTPLNRKK